MKSEAQPRLGVVDAISVGLSQTGRRLWLILIPAAIDFWLWLGPQISIAPLLQRMLANLDQSLQQGPYMQAQLAGADGMVRLIHDGMAALGPQINLMEGITGGWLGAPSALSAFQFTRFTFISDLVLAPAGLSRQLPHFGGRGQPIQIDRVSTMLLVMAAAWLVGQLLLTAYLRWAGAGRGPAAQPGIWHGPAGYLRLFWRLTLFSILLGAAVLVLQMPLGFAVLMLSLSGGSLIGLFALLFGGVALWLTMWFLLALFFVNEGILLEQQSLGRSLAISVALVHRNFGSAVGLAVLVNVLIYGFRIIWDLLGRWPAGTVVAILGNAYLATSMLLATFAFFESLHKAAVAQQAKVVN